MAWARLGCVVLWRGLTYCRVGLVWEQCVVAEFSFVCYNFHGAMKRRNTLYIGSSSDNLKNTRLLMTSFN